MDLWSTGFLHKDSNASDYLNDNLWHRNLSQQKKIVYFSSFFFYFPKKEFIFCLGGTLKTSFSLKIYPLSNCAFFAWCFSLEDLLCQKRNLKLLLYGTLQIISKFTTQNKKNKKENHCFFTRQFCASLNIDFRQSDPFSPRFMRDNKQKKIPSSDF
jgi:hypothetical protein